MSSDSSEVLVEFEDGADLDDALPPGAVILQRLPPRLAIVAADEASIRALERDPEVRAVFAEAVPPDALERLDQVSRIFAEGWNVRRRPKARPGEGLPWDAPGFDAP